MKKFVHVQPWRGMQSARVGMRAKQGHSMHGQHALRILAAGHALPHVDLRPSLCDFAARQGGSGQHETISPYIRGCSANKQAHLFVLSLTHACCSRGQTGGMHGAWCTPHYKKHELMKVAQLWQAHGSKHMHAHMFPHACCMHACMHA